MESRVQPKMIPLKTKASVLPQCVLASTPHRGHLGCVGIYSFGPDLRDNLAGCRSFGTIYMTWRKRDYLAEVEGLIVPYLQMNAPRAARVNCVPR
jgi:hypothetical protein